MGDRSKPIPSSDIITRKGSKIGSVILYINRTMGLL
jgi:hypothetical protein